MNIVRKMVKCYKDLILLIIFPLLFSLIPIYFGTTASKCGFVMLLMILYWVLVLVPLPVTALLPVVLFPLLGIMNTGSVSQTYMKATTLLFMGGMMMAVAVEASNLHRRIALVTLNYFGTSPKMLMLGLMLSTAFLSMWISNTATTALMIPIVEALLETMSSKHPAIHDDNDEGVNETKTSDNIRLQEAADDSNFQNDFESLEDVSGMKKQEETKLRQMMMMSVAYSANVGGTATIVGTGPNLVLTEYLDKYQYHRISFATWMLYAVPQMILCLCIIWLWLQFYYIGFRKKKNAEQTSKADIMQNKIKKIIALQYKNLSPQISFHEMIVLFCFIIVVALWFFRSPGFMTGWADVIKDRNGNIHVGGATPAMLVVFMLFVLPSKQFKTQELTTYPRALDWKTVHEKLSWGVLILIGGGFALAEGSKQSGLSKWIGEQIVLLTGLPNWLMLITFSLVISFFTEVASNVATASIILPVLLQLSKVNGLNPVYLMLPVTFSCSFAFMLPVATPPNAIAFEASKISTFEMMKLGIFVNILCLFTMFVCFFTYGVYIFGQSDQSNWD